MAVYTLREVLPGETVLATLRRLGVAVDAPCGGRGTCRKCTVMVDGVPVLACETLARAEMVVQVQTAPEEIHSAPLTDIPAAVAVDLGTTSITVAAVNADGRILAQCTQMNAQRSFGADVIARIQAANAGDLSALRDCVRGQLEGMARALLGAQSVPTTAVAGNTVMLHLLFGAPCAGLGTYPYAPAFLDAQCAEGSDFGWTWTRKVCTPPGLHSFCGADITAGLLSLADAPPPFLLADLGTNAELALVTVDGILCTSAAAGPVFEGAGIACGMPALPGALSRVQILGTRVQTETIGGEPPTGICASGLVDALAELRRSYQLTADGTLRQDFPLAPNVVLTQADVRAFQIGKAAVATGIALLCDAAKLRPAELQALFVAGSLGSALRTQNAIRLGLFPPQTALTAIGNSALRGAIAYALDENARARAARIAARAQYLDLALMPDFSEKLLQQMDFPTREAQP
ncbi:MAG: ASKHA domain-containing protein [Oscillospiraceae bacterium]|jgi:uncharacterized 2Fe-2S/4Fe-4S cluster protein (DUF4445 family)|nr:ASKHA domain-containing protein [Oscillospiraceae bacterium]